jgi:hypothetical protein
MQRADTPEQPTKEDEAKARKRAYNKAYHKTYYAANAEHQKTRNKAWRLANPTYNKKSREKNRELKKATDQAWRLANPTYNKEYYEKNAESIQSQNKEKRGCVDCRSWLDWRVGLPHYDEHCFRCFRRKFPTHEKVKSKARVEWVVRDLKLHQPHLPRLRAR